MPIVITDQGFAQPGDAYFDTVSMDRVLGQYTRAVLPEDHSVAVRAFYEWVGVAQEPRPRDLMRRVSDLVAGPVTVEASAAVSRIVDYLGTRWKVAPRPSLADQEWLTSLRWLPARSDSTRWYRPDELYVVFSEYLFASQARFLGLPLTVQQVATDFLLALGVGSAPTTAQVVQHLLNCATHTTGMNPEVYTYLNQHADEHEIAMLKTQESILLPDGAWVRPNWVFWGDQPFGRFRATLSDDFHRFRALLGRLGVRDSPDHSDAFSVLLEMSSELAPMNTPVDSERDRQVYASCWRLLADDLASKRVQSSSFTALRGQKVIADGEWLLTDPHWILFEDLPGLADRFPVALKKQLIRRPEGYWTAMKEAGVRDLSRAVTSQVLELGDYEEDRHLRALVEGRTSQVGRVIDAVDPQWALTLPSRLGELRFVTATELVVQFLLSDLKLGSPPVSLQTLYDPGTDTLFIRRGVSVRDLELAREVARALVPDVPPGSLAPSFGLVLGAGSPEEADLSLDAAGVARLAEDVVGEAEGQIVTGFGGERGTAGTSTSQDSGEPGGGPGDDSDRARPRAARGRLRSYVLSETTSEESVASEDHEREISAIDRAGVDRVMEYELAAGRTPTEMEHLNPGYDVESSSADGRVLRYIEVKSLSGDWTDFGVSVTPRQMDEARHRRQLFWLYVVERAQSHDFVVHPIQDPWTKVSQFMFDDPWKLTAVVANSTCDESHAPNGDKGDSTA